MAIREHRWNGTKLVINMSGPWPCLLGRVLTVGALRYIHRSKEQPVRGCRRGQLPHSAISSSAIMGEGWKESGDPSSCFPFLFCRKETHLRECRPAVHIQTEPSHLGVSEHVRNEGSLCGARCVVACPFHGGTQRQTQKSMEAVLP